jgi:Cytochrome B561
MPPIVGHSTHRYGSVAILLHWTIAAIILGMLALGVVMTELSPGNRLKFVLYQWHKSFGVLVFLLSLVRLGWRLAHPPPPWPPTMAGWERLAAATTHGLFYALTLGLPLSGWMLVSASPWNIPTVPFGLFTLPHLSPLADHPDKRALADAFAHVHTAGALGIALLLVVHVAAALRHHLILGDDVLTRMWPRRWHRSSPLTIRKGSDR